jgi:hypothetical protein
MGKGHKAGEDNRFVLSPLRDYEVPARRRKIMDVMISAAYRLKGTTDTEEEWRIRVESKLREQQPNKSGLSKV